MIFLNKKDDLVWAKIKNFPWWPAYVCDIIRGNVYEQLRVNFINMDLEITLSNNKVADYKRYFSKYYDKNNNDLKAACLVADSIHGKSIDFWKIKETWKGLSIPTQVIETLKLNISIEKPDKNVNSDARKSNSKGKNPVLKKRPRIDKQNIKEDNCDKNMYQNDKNYSFGRGKADKRLKVDNTKNRKKTDRSPKNDLKNPNESSQTTIDQNLTLKTLGVDFNQSSNKSTNRKLHFNSADSKKSEGSKEKPDNKRNFNTNQSIVSQNGGMNVPQNVSQIQINQNNYNNNNLYPGQVPNGHYQGQVPNRHYQGQVPNGHYQGQVPNGHEAYMDIQAKEKIWSFEIQLRDLLLKLAHLKEQKLSLTKNLILNELSNLLSIMSCETFWININPEILMSSKIGKYLKSLQILQTSIKDMVPCHQHELFQMLNNQLSRMKERIINRFLDLDITIFENDYELSKILYPEINKFNLEKKIEQNRHNYQINQNEYNIKYEDLKDHIEIIDISDCDSDNASKSKEIEEHTGKQTPNSQNDSTEIPIDKIATKYEGEELPSIRRKVCRKVHNFLTKEFNIEKKNSKIATLNFEHRLNYLLGHDNQDYVQVIKKVFLYFKKHKNDISILDEIRKIQKLGKSDLMSYVNDLVQLN